VLVAALLAATAAAFAYTEKLKLTPSPILGTRVTKLFSPVCECPTDAAVIGFRLREPDRVTVSIVDGARRELRRLVQGQPERAGVELAYVWDGRDGDGLVVPEGAYRPRVRLEHQRRTILLPNPIRVDTTPPNVTLRSLAPRVFSPDGDGRADRVRAGYRLDEPAQVSLFVDGTQAVLKKRGRETEGTVEWFGRVDGRRLPPGVYRLALAARDAAGNLGRRTRPRPVVLRYVALGRDRIVTRPGAQLAVLVVADARQVRWTLGRLGGTARPGTLRLRAPLQPGRYTLTVRVGENAARAAVFVQRPPA
jgi:hypothetical protein